MGVGEYEPRSTLKVPEHPVTRAKYPFIDVHGHQQTLTAERAAALVGEMDALNMGLMVNLSGGSGDALGRAFFIKYQDRILMGKDSYEQGEYHTHFRIFETADEYFPYYRNYHAFWRMYGMDLPDDVLKKVYYKNAIRVIPGIDASRFPR